MKINKLFSKQMRLELNPCNLFLFIVKYHLKWPEKEKRHISTIRKGEIISARS